MAMSWVLLFVFAEAAAGAAHLASAGTAAVQLRARGKGEKDTLDASAGKAAGSLVKPIVFNRQLLICNAYASKSPMSLSKNGRKILEGNNALRFGECRDVNAGVLAKDKLDFMEGSAGIQGTFEVGDLPESDVVLLLVLQRRDQTSALVSFQSFAFPMNTETDQANLAVIDASPGLPKAHLQVTDVPVQNTKAAPASSSLTEELNFDRIYALDQGDYKLTLSESHESSPGDSKAARRGGASSPQTVQLSGKRNYVVLRTVDRDGKESLVTFPREEMKARSGAASPALLGALFALGLRALA